MKLFLRALLGAALGGICAWFTYAWLLGFLNPFTEQIFVSDSIHQALLHKTIFSISIGSLGLLIGVFAGRGLKTVLGLVAISTLTIVLWLIFIRYRMEDLHANAQRSTDAVFLKFNITSVPLYEVGLVSIFVVACVILGISLKNRR
jgi:hypothetical protein